MLYKDFTYKIQQSNTIQIGTITFKKKVAERKYSEQVIWEGLPQNAPLFNFDSIRTDKGSSAVINLGDGTQIDLDEETMIVLNSSAGGMNINFEKGAISAKRAEGSSENAVNISAGGSTVQIDKGDVNLAKAENSENVSLNVSEGNVTLKSGDKVQSLNNESSAVLSKEGAEIKRINISPVIPEQSKYIVSTASSERVDFSWQQDNAGEVTLQVATDSSFKNIVVNDSVKGTSASSSFSDGSYYWRVVSGTDKSPIRRFTIVGETAAIPIAPKGTSYTYRNSNPMINFKWKPSSAASSYLLQISDKPDMSNITLELSASGNSISTDNLEAGLYYWRVINNYGFASKNSKVASDVNSFEITKKTEVSRVELIYPSRKMSFSSMSSNVTFNWSPNSDSKEYIITVTQTSPSKKTIFNETVYNNYFKSDEAFPEGKFSWSVVAVAADGTNSPVSEKYDFSVSSPQKISTTEPSDNVKISPSDALSFVWNDPNGGGKYYFELASDPDFANVIINQKVSGTYTIVKKLNEGKYYWRVYLIDSNENRLIGSNVSSFSIESSLVAPVLLSPINNDKLEMKDKIIFTWQKVSNANIYKFSLYSSTGKSKLIYSTETSDTKFVFDDSSLMKSGNYFWEIEALKSESGSTISKSAPSREYFNVVKKEVLPSPVITSPPVIILE